jgi:hypothetical protein
MEKSTRRLKHAGGCHFIFYYEAKRVTKQSQLRPHGAKEMQPACRTHLAGGYFLLRSEASNKAKPITTPRGQRDAASLPHALGRRLFFIIELVCHKKPAFFFNFAQATILALL